MAIKQPRKHPADAPAGAPIFSQPEPTSDPGKFRIPHPSDTAAYTILDKEAKTLKPLPFPQARGGVEPILRLEDVFGAQEGPAVVQAVTKRKQIVFHAVGDTGNTRSVGLQNAVTHKLVSDFNELDQSQVPDRTTMIAPGVYFTLDAPLVRILGLYSNRLEDPGVISSQGGSVQQLTDVQLTFLKAALQRIADEEFAGAVIIAVHHPPYTTGKHGGSPLMLKDIDAACKKTGVWPHAVLSGHAHSYQRYTRAINKMEIPYIIAGNSGHGLTPLVRSGEPALRVPARTPSDANVTFENYDDRDYGYLRVVVTPQQLRLEYHPATDGAAAKTPDDAVTVDLASRTLVHFKAAKA